MPWIGSTSILGILRVARRKPLSISAPSMISALATPSFSKWPLSSLVLVSASLASSMRTMPPSLTMAESACLRARTRTFLGRSIAWLRTTGPNERPPPRNRLARWEPWRAPPVPFCLYIFLPVRQISARPLALWVPAWRLLSCHCTQRAMMSWRGSRPKISSESCTEPAALPSRVVTFSSISRALLLGRRFRGLLTARDLELAGLRRFLRQRLLHGVTHRDPTALGAGNGAFDQDQAALDIGLHHTQIERGDAVDTHVAGHLLVLPGLAGIMTAAGRTDRTVRDRHAVGGAQAAEIPALHAAGKALADRGAGDIDKLADHEMVGLDFSPHRNQRVFRDAELRDLALRLDLGDRELAALGLRQIDGLAGAGPELQRDITVRLGRAVAQHLAIAQLQHGHGDMLAGLRKDPRHPDLLCDHSGAHRCASCSFCPEGLANLQCEHDPIRKPAPTFRASSELDLDVDAGGQIELHQRIDGLRGRIDDVEQALVRAQLELLAALLGDMRRTVDGELLDAGRQRNGSANLRTGTFRRVHDLTRRRIENPMVERLEAYANILAVHLVSLSSSSPAEAGDPVLRSVAVNSKPRGVLDAPLSRGMTAMLHSYSMIAATTPAPTVRPPSRIANRSFSSIAIGTIRCTSIAMLSPGITISVPSGRCTTPVTSVVRK